jgi:MFS family permease
VSDLIGRRKGVAVCGYGLAAIVKPVFPLSSSAGSVLVARILDRIGKGIRGAPRDALVAELAPKDIRGACFGLRQSLDTIGAFIGPLAATALLFIVPGDYRFVMFLAVPPAFVAVALLVLFVKEPAERSQSSTHGSMRSLVDGVRRLPSPFWSLLVVTGAYSLTRFSEAFLILRSVEVGLDTQLAPLVLVAMNIIYALSSYPATKLSDSKGRRVVFVTGVMILIIADLFLVMGSSWTGIFIGVLFWGLHMGFTQGVLSSMVADCAPKEVVATAFGLFNLVSGIGLLVASGAAGWIWDAFGSKTAYGAGAALAVGALALTFAIVPEKGASARLP